MVEGSYFPSNYYNYFLFQIGFKVEFERANDIVGGERQDGEQDIEIGQNGDARNKLQIDSLISDAMTIINNDVLVGYGLQLEMFRVGFPIYCKQK